MRPKMGPQAVAVLPFSLQLPLTASVTAAVQAACGLASQSLIVRLPAKAKQPATMASITAMSVSGAYVNYRAGVGYLCLESFKNLSRPGAEPHTRAAWTPGGMLPEQPLHVGRIALCRR
jgi:hypothetical protein